MSQDLSSAEQGQDTGPSIFLSCLGTSPYRSLRYSAHVGESHLNLPSVESRFVQLARIKTLAQRGMVLDGAYILVTEGAGGARERNWDDGGQAHVPGAPEAGLDSELRAAGLEATAVSIESGANEDEMWTIFRQVVDLVPHKARIYVDLTHGFRTLPVILLLALEYAEKVKDASIVELTYGADRAVEGSTDSPTWNLEPFLVIRKWADAVDSFVSYGDTRPLAEATGNLKLALGREMPRELGGLHRSLRAFGDAIQKCHSPGVPAAAMRLRKLVKIAQEDSLENPRLEPLGLLLEKISRKLVAFPDSEEPNAIEAQYAAAKWCVDHNLTIQALTFLREGVVAVFDAALSREDLGYCLTGEDAIGWLGRLWSKQELNEAARSALDPLLAKPPFSEGAFATLAIQLPSLIELRNKLNHAYSGKNIKDKAPVSDSDFSRRASEYLQLFRQLIDELAAVRDINQKETV